MLFYIGLMSGVLLYILWRVFLSAKGYILFENSINKILNARAKLQCEKINSEIKKIQLQIEELKTKEPTDITLRYIGVLENDIRYLQYLMSITQMFN